VEKGERGNFARYEERFGVWFGKMVKALLKENQLYKGILLKYESTN
jgi:hypothetical protein